MEIRNYSNIFRSIIFLTGAFAVGGNGFANQREHQRSISMSSLWAMGFGKTNVDEIISWGQPSSVSRVVMLLFFVDDKLPTCR